MGSNRQYLDRVFACICMLTVLQNQTNAIGDRETQTRDLIGQMLKPKTHIWSDTNQIIRLCF